MLKYVLPPLFYVAVAYIGGAFTARGVQTWYPAIVKPEITPPGGVIGAVWTVLYILAALSFIMLLKSCKGSLVCGLAISVYLVNGVLNAAWSWIFFDRHLLGFAVMDSALIGLTVIVMMYLAWPHSRIASLLLAPYLIWVSFATYLSYQIYRLN